MLTVQSCKTAEKKLKEIIIKGKKEKTNSTCLLSVVLYNFVQTFFQRFVKLSSSVGVRLSACKFLGPVYTV